MRTVGSHLPFGAAIDPPEPALVMYEAFPDLVMAEKPEVVEWSEQLGAAIVAQFDGQYENWKFVRKPDLLWASPKLVPRRIFFPSFGRRRRSRPRSPFVLKGNCNDWSPTLLRRCRGPVGIPRGAMRLVRCSFRRQEHLLLSIETTKGSFICCNLSRCHFLKDVNRGGNYTWHSCEGHDGRWRSLKSVPLDQLVGGKHGSSA